MFMCKNEKLSISVFLVLNGEFLMNSIAINWKLWFLPSLSKFFSLEGNGIYCYHPWQELDRFNWAVHREYCKTGQLHIYTVIYLKELYGRLVLLLQACLAGWADRQQTLILPNHMYDGTHTSLHYSIPKAS